MTAEDRIPDDLDLDELEALAKEATPGPWYVRVVEPALEVCDGLGAMVAQVAYLGLESDGQAQADAALMAAAPALIERLRQAEQECRSLEREMSESVAYWRDRANADEAKLAAAEKMVKAHPGHLLNDDGETCWTCEQIAKEGPA